MGAAVGTDEKGSVNVELNIVPFIDLMSCLAAFLLATAVWVNIAQINIQPKGKARDTDRVQEENEEPVLSVLLQSDQIWVGVSRLNDFRPIAKLPGGEHDWEKFRATLDEQKKTNFKDRTDIEIAAEGSTASPVKYQDLIMAMDTAVLAKFTDPGLSDPAGLTSRPTL